MQISAGLEEMSDGMVRVGDFTIAITDITRGEKLTRLSFAVTRVDAGGTMPGLMAVVLIDDHDNRYQSELNISPRGSPADLYSLLPIDFVYIVSTSIAVPKEAPIVKIKLGEGENIIFKDMQFVTPMFGTHFGNASTDFGETLSISEYLTFAIGRPLATVVGWELPVTAENAEYNSRAFEVRVAVQFRDGYIRWPVNGGVAGHVPGSSSATLTPEFIKVSAAMSHGSPQTILIYIVDMSSGNRSLRLMRASADLFPPVPKRIASWEFTIYDGSGFNKEAGINVASIDGLNKMHITAGFQPSFSPDGLRIAFVDSGLRVANADGSDATLVAENGLMPAWSPDGTKLAFVGEIGRLGYQTISVVSADGSALRILYTGVNWGTYPSNPTWSSDGTRIAFESGFARPTIKIVKVQGSDDISELLPNEPSHNPAWSPDGTKMALVYGYWAGDRDIAVVNVDGSGLRKLFDGYAFSVAWSPDGSKIAFASDGILLVMNADGTGLSTIGAGSGPSWAPALKLTETGLVPVNSSKDMRSAETPMTTATPRIGASP